MKSYLNPSRIRTELVGLFAWWIHELKDLTDAVLLRLAPRLATRVRVTFDATGGSICTVRGKETQDVLRFSNNEAFQLPTALQGANATLALEPAEVLVHSLRVPRVVKGELDGIVALYLERELPLSRERVCIDHRVESDKRDPRQVEVRLSIAHRERVEQLQAMAAAWGLRPRRIGVQDGSGGVVGNFLRRRSRFERVTLSPLDRKLVMSAAALLLGSAVTVAAQWGYERVQVGREMKRAVAAAKEAQLLIQKLQSELAPATALTRLSGLPDAADVLPVLTEAVPADSWFYQLDVSAVPNRAPQINASGFAPAATMLIDTLEKSPRFQNVRLVSAMSAGLGMAQDRVQLSADWESQ